MTKRGIENLEKLVIHGGRELHGEVEIGGAKNAVLALLAGTLLAQDVCVLHNVPNISDVDNMLEMLKALGADIKRLGVHDYSIDTKNVNVYVVEHQLADRLRASYYFLGALLGRFKRARVACPGGCNFGTRPMDLHLSGFELLGAKCNTAHGIINCSADTLTGATILLDIASVGATINIMLAAVKARGLTIIENAAREPHIVDLANFLNQMGARISGAGTNVIKIYGVTDMHGCEYTVVPDQIEAGTYMLAAAVAGGDVTIKNVIPKHLESITAKLSESGVKVIEGDDYIQIISDRNFDPVRIKTAPHPGFPTDMQPQIAVMLTLAKGTSVISEGVWKNRFQYTGQLLKMGAKIQVDGTIAIFEGVEELTGAPVRADDLRAGAAMIIAGLVASGKTEITDIKYIDRGYEDYIGKLRAIGADIYRVSDDGSSAEVSLA